MGEQCQEIFDGLLQGDENVKGRIGDGQSQCEALLRGCGGGRPDVDIFTPSGEVTEKSVRRGEDTCLLFFFFFKSLRLMYLSVGFSWGKCFMSLAWGVESDMPARL